MTISLLLDFSSMGATTEIPRFDISTHCKAGVVINEGPDFHVEVQMVPVPEPGEYFYPYRHLQSGQDT